MSVVEYLREQATTCQRLARATFDLTTAERLRFLAAELRAKAAELEDQETIDAHMIQGNGYARSTSRD